MLHQTDTTMTNTTLTQNENTVLNAIVNALEIKGSTSISFQDVMDNVTDFVSPYIAYSISIKKVEELVIDLAKKNFISVDCAWNIVKK